MSRKNRGGGEGKVGNSEFWSRPIDNKMENMVHCIWFRRGPYFYAGMAELADVQDLGSCVARRAGSSPVARTNPGSSDRLLDPVFFM